MLQACRLAIVFVVVASGAVHAADPGTAEFASDPPGPSYHLKVLADADGRDRIAAEGLDIAGHNLRENWVHVITYRQGLSWLRAHGFEVEILEVYERPVPLGASAARATDEPGVDIPLPDQKYTDPAELEVYLNQVAADHPDITRLVDIGTSHQGRTMRGLMISDNAAVDEDELTILFSGAHHAREVMTPEVVIDTIDHLTDNYGIDPDLTARVDDYQIWCVPMVNPDGVNIVFVTEQDWRKNARDNDGNMIINFNDGVDLNRNYEWGWGGQCRGSSGTFSSATYRGPSEASEPEMQAMIPLGRMIRPVFDVEYHSYGEDVFYAMSCQPDRFNPTLDTIVGPDQEISRVIAEAYASRIIQADGGLGYSSASFGSAVDGVGRDTQYHENGAIAFVTEINSLLEGGFRPDYDTWRDATVEGQRPGWLWLIDRMVGPAVGGHVLDAMTGLPLEADVALDEMHLPDGKRLSSRPDTGRFHIIVVPGDYTLRVNVPGYEEAVVTLTVGADFQPLQVDLQPRGSSFVVQEHFEDALAASMWTVGDPGDTATSGIWEWGEPDGTHSGDLDPQTGLGDLAYWNARFDRTAGEGHRAFVTGNTIAAGFTEDDVDGGATTLSSPAYDLGGLYAVQVSWQRWLSKDALDPVDGLEAEVSADGGQSWVTLESLTETTATADASPAWAPTSVRLDDFVAPGLDVRFRFRASDTGPGSTVEAAIDDLQIRGFSLSTQGEITGVQVDGNDSTVLSWNPATGAPDAVYDVARGELANLSGDAGGVDLGALTCVEENSPDTTTAGNPDTDTPPVGTGRFYLVRFNLGFSVGGWGQGSDAGDRQGTGGCSP